MKDAKNALDFLIVTVLAVKLDSTLKTDTELQNEERILRLLTENVSAQVQMETVIAHA
jgi:hypothetical protein